MSGKLIVVVGGQFGSEAKGHVAAQLAVRENEPPLVIRVGGPNAGHTVWGSDGVEYKLRHIPTAVAVRPSARLAIAPGSEVDLQVLADEIDVLKKAELLQPRNVLVDRNATLLTEEHRMREADDSGLVGWSTCKGIGAARSDRVRRVAETVGSHIDGQVIDDWIIRGWVVSDVTHIARTTLQAGGTVIVEGAQGYGLGLHTEYYPKTTSGDCRAIDALAAVGLSPWDNVIRHLEVWVVVRPYPIRVAGDSGPMHDETEWSDLGLPEERTTVTNKIRRVGAWDSELVRKALIANGGGSNGTTKVALMMLDQVVPSAKGVTLWSQIPADARPSVRRWMREVQECGGSVRMLGTGPQTVVMT